MPSPFLLIPETAWVASNDLAFAFRDRYPVSPGHTLIVTRREVPTCFDMTAEEQAAVWSLAGEVKRALDAEFHPQGYNVGFNAGAAAGQTVMHVHLHVIPRYDGDMEDPRGGVRHVIPWKGNYLATRASALVEGAPHDPFLYHLRPLFVRASEVAIVTAFAFPGGLRLLEPSIRDAVARGARVRLIAGDYEHSTPADAFRQMLDWRDEIAAGEAGRFEPRVIEVARHPIESFHPKSWRFEGPDQGSAFVGSSNISKRALLTGVEWNLRLDRSRDPEGWQRLVSAYEQLWRWASPLDADWIAAYRRAEIARPVRTVETDEEPAQAPPVPHEIQVEALRALAATRQEGRTRALVVLATGLGKTLLAAFDVARFGGRTLFLVHRAEILTQAAEAFRRLHPTARFGWCVGSQEDLHGDVVFASVQKLSRTEQLERLTQYSFEYVVVDEVHHASAASYRRILERLQPRFMLGLTATPDRADEADILPLFDDNLAYRADAGVGIRRGYLASFRYWGLRDTVDYAPIPWRNGRFDPDLLATAVQTTARMEQMWKAWLDHPGARTIIFCCTISHARFVRDWLKEKLVRVEAIHTGPDSADRVTVLEQLRDGELDAVCAVDLLNEGVDIPSVDRVLMLRPTESPVVFLQQLGRGLRKAPGKAALEVVDFVGNHRIFLDRVRLLLAMSSQPASLAAYLAGTATLDLPPGCSVELELEAKEILRKLLPSGARNELVRVFRELRASRGVRPTAGELYRMGLNPRSLSGGWVRFCRDEDALDAEEVATLEIAERWLRDLESTPMTKCFKMVVLAVLLDADALTHGMALDELASRSHAMLLRSPELLHDLDDVAALPDPKHPDPVRWRAYWRDNPIAAWTSGRHFVVEGTRFVSRLPVAPALARLTGELVDLRLAQYRARGRQAPERGAFEARLTWNQRDPILKLPAEAPRGELDVRLPDGAIWQFRLSKEFCNVARPVGTESNRLGELLRGWFGPSAGRPGTTFSLRFSPAPEGWWVEPARGQILAFAPRSAFTVYPDLRAAAGAQGESRLEVEPATARLPGNPGLDRFAVRASGDSMDGGPKPIRDGDWVVFHAVRGVGLGAAEGQIALVGVGDEHTGVSFHIKRVGREALRSDNPSVAPIPISAETAVYALHTETIRPEDLAPPVGACFDEESLSAAFDLSSPPDGRVDGHLFLRASAFDAPDRLRRIVPDRRPAETAYILAMLPSGTIRYCGVGRWRDGAWAFPAFDYASWQEIGGRGVSRTLEERWLAAARSLAEQVPMGPVEVEGRRCTVVGRAAEGGLRVEVGSGERTISLTDLGWVLNAAEYARSSGAILDEALVNRLRYLEGTPKGSTRWIDTGWAILIARSKRLDIRA